MFPDNNRIRVYIDGFNVYFSMKESGWRKYYWLDVWRFSIKLLQKAKSQQFIQADGMIDAVRYFTSRIGDTGRQKAKAARQNAYLEALAENSNQYKTNLTISFGQYQFKPYECRHCGKISNHPIEKMTDVNLATDLLVDAFFDKFGTAIVVSGDSDLRSPIQKVKELFTDKRVIVAMPPGRWSKELADSSFKYLLVEEKQFRQCQLPNDIIRASDEFTISRPSVWM